MLTPPDLASDTIAAMLREQWGLRARSATFLPLGADVNSFVFRVEMDDDAVYFLKLRRGAFDSVTVETPAYLRDSGVNAVMAALPTRSGALWASGQSFIWLLYPFFTGANGFAAPLSPAQWRLLGQSLRAIHDLPLPSELRRRIPVEDYSPRWRQITHDFDQRVAAGAFEDEPVAARLAALWRANREVISHLVAASSELVASLGHRTLPLVLCHTDLHAGNVLVGERDTLAIVDWDAPLLAPRERDLMFIGGGIGDVWTRPDEGAGFYEGYGATEIDAQALAYYRVERIVVDLAEYGMQIFGAQGSVEDREFGLRQVTGLFDASSVLDIALQTHAAYLRSADSLR